MRRPIERPTIRWTPWDGTAVPGWKVVCNFEDGHSETTWQRFDDAVKWAVAQVGPRESPGRVHVPTFAELEQVAPPRRIIVEDPAPYLTLPNPEPWREWMPGGQQSYRRGGL